MNLVFTGTGVHSGVFYVDHELAESVNTFFNELGSALGSPSAGQSWEIDEPGFSADPGDIFNNFLAGLLDNTVGKIDPDDVSMALGWSFVLNAGETGTIRFLLAESAPVEGFYLRQTDPDSKESIYFSSSLSIVGGPVVPETLSIVPSSVLALTAAGVIWRQRRSRITKRS